MIDKLSLDEKNDPTNEINKDNKLNHFEALIINTPRTSSEGDTLIDGQIDNEGKLPDHLDFTQSTLLACLQPVNSKSVTASTYDTTQVTLGMNSKKSSAILSDARADEVLGAAGKTSIEYINGLRQLDAPYNPDFTNQNVISSGMLSGVSMQENGDVVALFSNGTSKIIFKIPPAEFYGDNTFSYNDDPKLVGEVKSGALDDPTV
jgi:flagellar hook protein FlgE